MRFTVVWQPAAERELAAVWLQSRMRHIVRTIADRIDRQLAEDPQSVGESREGGRRIVVELPLVIEFEVVAQDRVVYVRAVRTC